MTKSKKKALLWLIIPLFAIFITILGLGIASIATSGVPYDTQSSEYDGSGSFNY